MKTDDSVSIDELTAKIHANKKYSGIDTNIIKRICVEKINNYKKQNELIKAVKNELHIIHESFINESNHRKAESLIDKYDGTGIIKDKIFASQLMSLHASTRERLQEAEEIYAYLSRYIPSDCSVTDLGCGFNPFALPFFTTQPASYTACDINISTINLLNNYFKKAGLLYNAKILDVVIQTPTEKTDVLLMLKLVPLLARQKQSRTLEIMDSINSKTLIISFPTRSASGKQKGMEKFYAEQFENTISNHLTILDKTVFKNEMFYIIDK